MEQKKTTQGTKQELRQQLKEIHSRCFKNKEDCPQFQEIDHGPSQICQQYFSVHQNCLVVNFDAFDRYYKYAFQIVKNHNQDIKQRLQAADILLAMNGQNDRAWNLKKMCLKEQTNNEHTHNSQKQMNLSWQTQFNAAVCLKCKKSSSYYQYRLILIDKELDMILKHQNPNQIKQSIQVTTQIKQSIQVMAQIKQSIQIMAQRENRLICRVLQRFFRNYFCWMYRIKLTKLIHFKLNNQFLNESIDQSAITQVKQQFLHQQLNHIHKFIQKYCNDYSGYSYLISFLERYYFMAQQNRIKQNLNVIVQSQLNWVKQLKQYCQVAYQSQENYRHLLMYENHLKNKIKNTPQTKSLQVKNIKQQQIHKE